MWFFTFEYSEEYELKLQIKTIVENWEPKSYNAVTWSWVTIVYNKFEIKLETDSDCSTLYSSCYVKFDSKKLFYNENSYDFLLDLCKIIFKKEKLKEENDKKREILERKSIEEEEKFSRQLLISEALASITWLELQKVSKEVKEEFNPIFADVTRIQEITSELNTIRGRYSAGWI